MDKMVQYGVWPDCTNNCDFCLRKNRKPYSKEEKLRWLDAIKKNIEIVDWINTFNRGISLLGGELYYIRDKDIRASFLELIDIIVEKILKPNELAKYSTVTNGIYKPDFLFEVVDRISAAVGMEKVDVNFSFDLKYRYKTQRSMDLAKHTINAFCNRYNYRAGVQMILTQNVINLTKEGKFNTHRFLDENFPMAQLCFLYPHKINTGKVLDDFFFKRNDFLEFLVNLREDDYPVYFAFVNSCKNSAVFKYTGLRDRISEFVNNPDGRGSHQIPILSDGKEDISPCGHSSLYRCYADSDKCMLCDILRLESQL